MDEPEGRIIGKDSEAVGIRWCKTPPCDEKKTQTTICDEHKQQYFESGYEAGKKDGYAEGRRYQAPRSFEGGREVGQAQVKVERKEWFKAEVLEKGWALDPETGGVVMTPALFDQMKAALTAALNQFKDQWWQALRALNLNYEDPQEKRVREYMRNSFSQATIDGVIRAMRGES